jgi:hypothetical protein
LSLAGDELGHSETDAFAQRAALEIPRIVRRHWWRGELELLAFEEQSRGEAA